MKEMQSANLSGPLKGLRPYHALLGLTQAPGFAGGFDSKTLRRASPAEQCRQQTTQSNEYPSFPEPYA